MGGGSSIEISGLDVAIAVGISGGPHMGWTKKIDTSDGKTYHVYERMNGTVDIHEQNSGTRGSGTNHGNYRSIRDAVSAIEGKSGARVTKIR